MVGEYLSEYHMYYILIYIDLSLIWYDYELVEMLYKLLW